MQDDIDGAVEVLKSSEGWTVGSKMLFSRRNTPHTIEQTNQEIWQLTTKKSKGKCGSYKKYVFK